MPTPFTAYASLDHVYLLGLSAQAFVSRAHPVESADVDISTGRIRYKGHGYSVLDRISFELTTGGSLPAELAASAAGLKSATATSASPVVLTSADLLDGGEAFIATYPRRLTFATAGVTPSHAPAYVVIVGTDLGDAVIGETLDLMQVAGVATSALAYNTISSLSYPAGGGTAATVAIGYVGFDFSYTAPVPLTYDLFQIARSDGSGLPFRSFSSAGAGWRIALDPERRLLANLAAEAAAINNDLTAHAPPIEVDPITLAYPMVVIRANAIRAALATVTTLQFQNPEARVAVDQLVAMKADVDKDLAEWMAGRPILPNPTDQTSIADNGARASSGLASGETYMPWTTGVL